MTTPVTDEQVKKLCGLGSGPLTCSFLAMGPDGFCCLKSDAQLRRVIELKRISGSMAAMGDNCSGPPRFDPAEIRVAGEVLPWLP